MTNYVIFAALTLVSFIGFWISLFALSASLTVVFFCFTLLYGYITVSSRT